ncbi:comF family protein [Parelusimicrobium proximum]|uniref:ComF family protein n=1 Tax=Parelusimicrobium proximum TaxID=3228953 RepID=UPI003D16888B
MLNKIENVKNIFLHILFPRTCFHCKADLERNGTAPLCEKCMANTDSPRIYCKRCGRELSSGGAHCFDCRGSKAAKYKCSIIRSAFILTPQMLSLVHAFKYHHYTSLSEFFIPAMQDAFISHPELHGANVIMPVPLHKSKERKRGYNQSALLAEGLAAALDIPYNNTSLKRVKNTVSQTTLSKKERKENTLTAFAAEGDVKGKTVLLIDDISTTSATLEACAAALKKAKAKKVFALVLARE